MPLLSKAQIMHSFLPFLYHCHWNLFQALFIYVTYSVHMDLYDILEYNRVAIIISFLDLPPHEPYILFCPFPLYQRTAKDFKSWIICLLEIIRIVIIFVYKHYIYISINLLAYRLASWKTSSSVSKTPLIITWYITQDRFIPLMFIEK